MTDRERYEAMLDEITALKNIIKQQQAEIEKFEEENNRNFNKWLILDKRTKERYAELYNEAIGVAKAEAVKELIKRFKDMHSHNTTSVVSLVTVFDELNSLAKEMGVE